MSGTPLPQQSLTLSSAGVKESQLVPTWALGTRGRQEGCSGQELGGQGLGGLNLRPGASGLQLCPPTPGPAASPPIMVALATHRDQGSSGTLTHLPCSLWACSGAEWAWAAWGEGPCRGACAWPVNDSIYLS